MEHNDRYVLKFTRDEYCQMIEELKSGRYDLFVEIVNRILSTKFRQWRSRSIVQMFDLGDDLYNHVMLCLIKESRNLISRDGYVVDPHYFQALVFTVAKGRALNFIDREKYAHGILSGKRFESLRQALGMEEDDEDDTARQRTYLPIVSIEAGGYSEDDEDTALILEDPTDAMATLEEIDHVERAIHNANDAVAASKLAAHKVLTWFLYNTSLRYNWYHAALTKAWMEQEFADKTLDELAAHLDAHRDIAYQARVSDAHLTTIREQLDACKQNVRIGDTVYESYRMENKTLRATISDWMNRWNTWLKDRGVV